MFFFCIDTTFQNVSKISNRFPPKLSSTNTFRTIINKLFENDISMREGSISTALITIKNKLNFYATSLEPISKRFFKDS